MVVPLLDNTYIQRLFRSIYGGYSTIDAGAVDEISEALDHVATQVTDTALSIWQRKEHGTNEKVSSSDMMEAIKKVTGPDLTRNITQAVNKAFAENPPGKNLKISTHPVCSTYSDAACLVT